MTFPHITVNGDGIADSGITLHCYLRDMPTENDNPAAVLNTVQPDGYQIVSTLQADMKVSTLNKEAHRGYKFPTLTQKLVSLTVIVDKIYNITLDITIIKVMKGGKKVMGGHMEQHTRLWILKLEDTPKD